MTEITVETVKLKNIQDKDLYYVRIKNGKEVVTINTGNKTYEAVNKLTGKKEVKAT